MEWCCKLTLAVGYEAKTTHAALMDPKGKKAIGGPKMTHPFNNKNPFMTPNLSFSAHTETEIMTCRLDVAHTKLF